MIRLYTIGQAAPLLSNPEMPNLKILALFRDPRGMLSSRAATFFKKKKLYGDEEEVCQQYGNNLKDALELSTNYPDKVKVIRYEDLAVEPESNTKEILDFIGLPMVKQMKNYINQHTKYVS